MTERDEAHAAYKDAVNMTRSPLEKWLDSDESKQVVQRSGGGESTGHASGRRIVDLLGTKKADLTDSDGAHMRKVSGYMKRHVELRPAKEDKERSRGRYSLRTGATTRRELAPAP